MELAIPHPHQLEPRAIEVPKLKSMNRDRLEEPHLRLLHNTQPSPIPPSVPTPIPPNPSPPYKEGPVQVQVSGASPWDSYERAYDIVLGGPITRVSHVESEEIKSNHRLWQDTGQHLTPC
jgi:hypothetical protein